MKHEPKPTTHMEKSQLQVWVGLYLGGMESQGISRGGQTVLVRLMASQTRHQSAGSVAEGFRRDNGLCPPFCLRENYPPSPVLTSDTSVLPHMPLGPFKLLP